MKAVPSARMKLVSSLHFTLAKQAVTVNTLKGLESVYLSKKPGTTRHLKRFKYSLETGQVLGFYHSNWNLSFQYANTKDVCFRLLYQGNKCSLLFQEDLLRTFICLDFRWKLQREPMVFKKQVHFVRKQA